MHHLRFEQLDQDVRFVIPLSVGREPFALPPLQIGEDATDKRDCLGVDFAVEGIEMFDDSDWWSAWL